MQQVPLPHPQLFRPKPQKPSPDLSFPLGLGVQGVHEICEARFGDIAALTGFALAAAKPQRGAIAWIGEISRELNHGHILGAGVSAIRRPAPPVLSIKARKTSEALWATEEAIRSSAVSLVIAEINHLDFTASRRLVLATSRHGVPAILLLPYTCEGATAATARWRVSARASAPNRYDPRAPGHTRWQATLERSRQAPQMAGRIFNLELDDETLSLSVASGLAAHTVAQSAARREDRNLAPTLKRRA